MITSAVQQASQMVEIQAAPAAEPPNGDTFRAAWAMSVGDSAAANTAGTANRPSSLPANFSSAKPKLVADLIAQKFSANLKQAIQTSQTAQTAQEVKSTLLTQTAASSNLKLGSEPAPIDEPASHDVSKSDLVATSDLRSAVLTPVSDENLIPAPTGASIALLASGSGTATPTHKEDGTGTSLSCAAIKSRKPEVSAPKDISSTTVPGTVSTDFVMPEAIALADVPLAPGASIGESPSAQAGTKLAILKSVSVSSDPASTTQSTNKSAAPQQQAFVNPAPVPNSQTTSDVSAIDNTSSLTGRVTGLTLDSELGHRIGDAAQPNAGHTVAFLSLDGPIEGPPLTDSSIKTAQSPNVTASSVSASTSAHLNESSNADGTAARTLAARHTDGSPQLLNASEKAFPKAVGSGTISTAKIEGISTEKGPQVTTGIVVPAGDGVVSTLTGLDLPLQSRVVPEPTNAGRAVRDTSSKVTASATKDGKSKTAVDISDQSSSSGASIALAAAGAGAATSPNSLPVSVGTGTHGVIAAAGVVAPITPANAVVVTSITHAGSSEGGSTPSTRVQTAASAGSLPETAPSNGQIGESHRTLLATPTTLEVGVQGGTQGWVKIRAEMGNQGAVNASLAAGSSGGRELLHSQMPALNAFLHSEQMTVTTTVVDRGTLAGGGGLATGSGGPGNTDGGGSNGSLLQGGEGQSDGARQHSSMQELSLSASETARSYAGVDGAKEPSSIRASASDGSGRWLNVRV